MMFAALSIRIKITFVLTLLLLTVTGMGILAIKKMQEIKSAASEIESKWLPSVAALGVIGLTTGNYRGVLREHILSETPEQMDVTEKQLKRISQRGGVERETYAKLIATPEERELFQTFVRQWEEYERQSLDVVAVDRKNLGKSLHEAHELNQKTVNPIGSKAADLLMKSVELNSKGAAAAIKSADETYNLAFNLVLIILGAAIVVGAGIGVYLVRDVSRGIASIVKPMQALGSGDLTADVPHQGETTEIGSMANALAVFKQALIDKSAADRVAHLDADATIQRGHRVDKITHQFEMLISELVDSLSSSSTRLEASAGTLTATAVRSQELTTMVAAASEVASTNVQSVASATEEMSSSVIEISRQVQESSRIASEAVDQAKTTNDRVGALSQAASRIGAVVELINTIAGQTNLLALNATIEAARAGDAGRGFAVVASEVKALAEQTAKATGEIGQQINSIQAATQDSVGAIREISVTIGRMSEISSTIASAVEEQGAATQEISRNVQQAAQGTQQVSSNISDVQRGAGETGSASSQVLSAAQSLSSDSNRLKLEVGKFLESLRAA
jgi:methyl-accepting chemotaxis protein